MWGLQSTSMMTVIFVYIVPDSSYLCGLRAILDIYEYDERIDKSRLTHRVLIAHEHRCQ